MPPADPAPCFAAISADDGDKIIGACGALIDNEKTSKADRLKALIARAGIFTRKDEGDRAIADYDVALQLDPSQADLFNSRGELWRKKGDRRKALLDTIQQRRQMIGIGGGLFGDGPGGMFGEILDQMFGYEDDADDDYDD